MLRYISIFICSISVLHSVNDVNSVDLNNRLSLFNTFADVNSEHYKRHIAWVMKSVSAKSNYALINVNNQYLGLSSGIISSIMDRCCEQDIKYITCMDLLYMYSSNTYDVERYDNDVKPDIYEFFTSSRQNENRKNFEEIMSKCIGYKKISSTANSIIIDALKCDKNEQESSDDSIVRKYKPCIVDLLWRLLLYCHDTAYIQNENIYTTLEDNKKKKILHCVQNSKDIILKKSKQNANKLCSLDFGEIDKSL